MEIKVEAKVSSVSKPSGIITQLKNFEEAILCFIFGPPELDEEALDKIREIIEKASKYMLSQESDS
jgi:hypothetical protein